MIWINCFWAAVNENNILKTCTTNNMFVQFNIYDNTNYLSMLSESKDCLRVVLSR